MGIVLVSSLHFQNGARVRKGWSFGLIIASPSRFNNTSQAADPTQQRQHVHWGRCTVSTLHLWTHSGQALCVQVRNKAKLGLLISMQRDCRNNWLCFSSIKFYRHGKCAYVIQSRDNIAQGHGHRWALIQVQTSYLHIPKFAWNCQISWFDRIVRVMKLLRTDCSNCLHFVDQFHHRNCLCRPSGP